MHALVLGASSKPPHGCFVISGLTLVTDSKTVLADYAIVIDDGVIKDLGPSSLLVHRYSEVLTLDGRGFVAMPGLINAHTHVAMGFFRGLCHGNEHMIEDIFFPAEKSLSKELLAPLSYSYIYAGLVSGVTCFGDHYYFSEGVAAAMEKIGVRGVIGETVADLGGAFPGRFGWERWRRLIDAWPYSQRLTPSVAPHSVETCSEPLLRELAEYASQRKLPLHIHLAQTQSEALFIKQRVGLTPVQVALRCGALSDRTLAVHLVTSSSDDHTILKDCGVTAVICPASQIIYEHLAPIASLMTSGIPIALGTDSAASNDTADLFAEMRLLALLARDRGVSEKQFRPEEVLRMTTEYPSRVLGLGDRIGSLAIGKAADIVFLKRDLSTEPSSHLLANLIYSFGSRNVRHVMIDGRFVLYNGQLALVSEDDLLAEYNMAVEELSLIHI